MSPSSGAFGPLAPVPAVLVLRLCSGTVRSEVGRKSPTLLRAIFGFIVYNVLLSVLRLHCQRGIVTLFLFCRGKKN